MTPDLFYLKGRQMNRSNAQEKNNNFHIIQFSKRFSVFIFAIFSCVILVTATLVFLLPKEPFSADENRMLTAFPSFSQSSLLEGEYTAQIASYLRDRMPSRSELLKTKALAEYALFKQENNHVIIAANSYLIKRFAYTDGQLATFRENVQRIVELKKVLSTPGKPAVFLCAPRAVDILGHRYSKMLAEPSERSPWHILSGADPDAITLQERFSQSVSRGEKIWFHTDHHWTAAGAYYAYEALGAVLGYTPLPRDSFLPVEVSRTFLGTSYSACQFPFVRPDTVIAMRYAGDTAYTCTNMLTGQRQTGFYVEEALAGKDHYQYFLGANTAHLRIQKDTEKPRPTLLLIKDSYAQCLVPYLARHFDIELIDLRYFRGDATETVREILQNGQYAGTLILCNADTLTASVGFDRIDADKLQ